MIEVYTSPNCALCVATKAWLRREGLQFNEFDVTKDAEAEKRCRAMGYQELPVVVAGEQHWSGFRHGHLMELKAMVRE